MNTHCFETRSDEATIGVTDLDGTRQEILRVSQETLLVEGIEARLRCEGSDEANGCQWLRSSTSSSSASFPTRVVFFEELSLAGRLRGRTPFDLYQYSSEAF